MALVSGQALDLCQAQKDMDALLGVAVVTTYEAKHYGCWLNHFSLIAKHPLGFFTKRFIAACAQINPSGRAFS